MRVMWACGVAGGWQGCNKMTCLKCGVFFCWLCLKVIQDYSHFQVIHYRAPFRTPALVRVSVVCMCDVCVICWFVCVVCVCVCV